MTLNADNLGGQVGSLLSHNIFAYCGNNPVNYSDPTGLWAQIGSVVYIDDKRIYDTYYSDKSKWPNKGFTYVYGSPPVAKAKKPTVKPQGSYYNGSSQKQGDVYIIKPGESVVNVNVSDVVVIDMRTEANPNMQIVDSYKITSPDAMIEILTLLQGYNTANPTNPAWVERMHLCLENGKLIIFYML